jgi:hypothetical protein
LLKNDFWRERREITIRGDEFERKIDSSRLMLRFFSVIRCGVVGLFQQPVKGALLTG